MRWRSPLMRWRVSRAGADAAAGGDGRRCFRSDRVRRARRDLLAGRLEMSQHVALGDPAAGPVAGTCETRRPLRSPSPDRRRERLAFGGLLRRLRRRARLTSLGAPCVAAPFATGFAGRAPRGPFAWWGRAAAESAGSMVATVAPTATVSPSGTAMRSTPEPAAGMSLVALSVSSSKRGSPARTSEPSALCQRERIPSEIDSPTEQYV